MSRSADIRSLNEEGLDRPGREKWAVPLSDAIMSGRQCLLLQERTSAGDTVRQARWESQPRRSSVRSLSLGTGPFTIHPRAHGSTEALRLHYKASTALGEYFDLHEGELHKGWEHSSVEALLQGFVRGGLRSLCRSKAKPGIKLGSSLMKGRRHWTCWMTSTRRSRSPLPRQDRERRKERGLPIPEYPPYQRCSSGEATLPQQRTEGNH